MLGAFLKGGRVEDYIALGDVGQPAHVSSLQIISALNRRKPGLANFLAVPKLNELGTSVDWYSPVAGEVLSWEEATESERNQASEALLAFRQDIKTFSADLVEAPSSSNEKKIFGKLLALAPYCPSESCIKLVRHEPQSGGVQAVLTFWGFVGNEADRNKSALYYLEKTPVVTPVAPIAPVAPVQPLSPVAAEEPRPWWAFWRIGLWGCLWMLLLPLLLLLLLSLLRGCAPALPSWAPALPEIPTSQWQSEYISQEVVQETVKTETYTLQEVDAATEQLQTELPASAPEASALSASENLGEQPAAIEEMPVETALNEMPLPDLNNAESQSVGIAGKEYREGVVAKEINGSFKAGGLQDDRTGKPLRVAYDLENGKGSIAVERPDGSVCKGKITAMLDGELAHVKGDDVAGCDDGTKYRVPEMACKSDGSSLENCIASYGDESIPMQMIKE